MSEASRLSLRLRDEEVDDASIPAVGDYEIRQADGAFGYLWGDYFEKSWRTSARYFEREGEFDFKNASTTSSFRWGMTEALNTELSYDFDRFESDGESSTSNSGFFSLSHRLYESVTTSLGLSGDHSDQEAGERATLGSNLSLAYSKRFPLDSRLLIDLDFRHRVEDNDFDAQQSRVRGEELPITDLSGNFLANRNVNSASIEVFESLSGAPLLEGIDYFFDVIGDRTSINPLPGGSIDPGDVVFVNYVFDLDSSAKVASKETSRSRCWTAAATPLGWTCEAGKALSRSGRQFSTNRIGRALWITTRRRSGRT
jgi:hypothetical protein